jgi:hypothetical protein
MPTATCCQSADYSILFIWLRALRSRGEVVVRYGFSSRAVSAFARTVKRFGDPEMSKEPGEPAFLAIYSLAGDAADTATRFRAAIEARHAAGDLTELIEIRFAGAFKVENRMTSSLSGPPVPEDVDGT